MRDPALRSVLPLPIRMIREMCEFLEGILAIVQLVRVRSCRHRIEEVFQQAKGEVGLAHYEVRSWVGWHHHVTLALLALWFLVLERRRLVGKTPAVTVVQMRAIFTEPLRKSPPTAPEIAAAVSRVLRRNE